MTTIKATVRNGRVEVKAPVDWPEGTEVIVQPVANEETFGIREEDWPESPQALAEWLQWYDTLEPLVFTEEERAAWEAARRQQKEFEKATFAERADQLRGSWK